jgi:hypothetical protein
MIGFRSALKKVVQSDSTLYFLLNLPVLVFVMYKLRRYSIHLIHSTTKGYLEALYSQEYRLLRFMYAHLKVTASFIRLCIFSCAMPVLFKSCFSWVSALYNECLDIDIA